MKRGRLKLESRRLSTLEFLGVMALSVALTGCHSGAGYRGAAYGPPPDQYGMAYEEGPMLDSGGIEMAGEKTFVDRHPLLSAPRNYYRDSSDNLFVKAFYGTFIGIPVGIARETWQVVYGQ